MSENPPPYPSPLTVRPPSSPWEETDRLGAAQADTELNVVEYVNLLWRHRWLVLATVVACVVLGSAWALTRPKMYRSAAKVTVQASPQLSSSQFDMYMSWWQMDRYIADQVHLLKTRQMAQRVVDRMGLEAHPAYGQSAASVLLGRIGVDHLDDTDVIEVSMVGHDPEHVAEVLNVYVQEYKAANIDDSLMRTKEIFDVIQSRLDPLRQQVEASEEQLMRFREREDALLFADQDKNVITEQVNTLTAEYAQAKADRIRLETKLNALRRLEAAALPESGFPEIQQDPTIQSLRQQRSALEVELREKLGTYKDAHPVIRELRSRIAGLETRLEEQIDTIRTSLQTDYEIGRRREESLYSNIQRLKEESIELSKQTLEFERLKREYEQNKAFFEEMLARSKEADISSTHPVNNIRIIEPALPAGAPFSPNVRRTVAMSLVLGLVLGVGLVLGLDYLDHTLRTPEQVERYLGLEVLSALPKLSDDNARVLRESFQALRTALMLAARGDGCQVVMVTSAVPSEGKTTVAFNLAKVLATGGGRVLLIDADLRKPRVHRLVDAKNVRGLTSVVLGERSTPEVVVPVSEIPGLDVMTSGPLPPNPPELYSKATFRDLLEEGRQRYDWILIDTPPVASVTDPVICSRLVDLALLVVQYGHAKRQVVREALRSLARTGVRIPGALLNKVDVERDHYYYSAYYSSYYSYGYGDESAEREGAAG